MPEDLASSMPVTPSSSRTDDDEPCLYCGGPGGVTETQTAEIIAILAHYGQTTKSEGMVYLHHPAAVAAAVANEYKAVAWLHDVLEDCAWVCEGHLRAAGIESATVEAVRILTHMKQQPYGEYIDDIIASGNRAAMIVKLADLTHNLRPSCPDHLRSKYLIAKTKLDAVLAHDDAVGDANARSQG
jgi:(p)ppGpp synthase/HD superfamily hydrolase